MSRVTLQTGSTRQWLRQLPILILVVAVFSGSCWLLLEGGARWFYGWSPANRLEVYSLRASLEPGMQIGEVEELLRARKGQLRHGWSEDRRVLSVWTHIGFARMCYLLIEVDQERVVHARIRGDEGEADRFVDAPPDF